MKPATQRVQAKTALTLYQKMGLQETASALTSEQILSIMQKTPANHIYKRPGKGGGQWDYVTGTYVEKVLNYVFAWDWDFEIKSKEEKYSQVVVLGRLTVRTLGGKSIFKEQIGRADIKYKKNTQIPLDYGNDEKAAVTDCLKKCASKFGIASDIYGKNEFKEIQTEIVVEDVVNEISDEMVKKLDETKTLEELIAVCKKIKAEIKPEFQKSLVNHYTRRKNELEDKASSDLVDEVDEGIKATTKKS